MLKKLLSLTLIIVFYGMAEECVAAGIINKVFDTGIVVFQKENNKYYSLK